MKTKTITPKINIFSKLYNFNRDLNTNEINPIKIEGDKLYLDKRLGTLVFYELKKSWNPNLTCTYVDNENTHCECGTEFNCNGPVKIKINKMDGIYAQQYICPRCKNTHVAKPDSREKYKTYEVKITKSFSLMQGIEYNSLRNIGEFIELLEHAHPSPQTIKNYITEQSEELRKLNENITYSGHYGYDEQHIKINNEKYYILAIIDVKLKVLVDFDVVDSLKKRVVKKFIDNATKNHARHSLTTDNKKMYRDIAEKLGFKHNLCFFHLIKNFNEVFDKILKNDKLTDDEIRQIIDYGTEIQDMLYSTTYERAKKRFNQLLGEIGKFPEEFQKFLESMEPVFREFMGHLKDKNLASTNNAMENFFGVNFPRRLKYLFKTVSGVKDYLTIKAYNWNKKVIDDLKQMGKTLMNYITCNKICLESMK